MRSHMMIVLCLGILFTATTARAISGAGAIALQFNTSVRAEGMGGAGIAVPWGGDVNNWANPALLAFRPGVRYDRMESQLVPDLADEIFIHSNQVTVGAYGVGLLFAQGPMDGVFLDMGNQISTNDDGTQGPTFDSWMKAQYHGIGVNLTHVIAALNNEQIPDILQRLDVSGGIVWKEFEDMLAPDYVLQDAQGGSSTARCHDLGLLASYRFIDSRGHGDGALSFLGGLMLAASAGISTLNTGGDFIVHVDADQADPLPKMHVKGWAVHAETGFPAKWESRDHSWLAEALTPLFSVTYSRQRIQPGITWVEADHDYVYGLDDDEVETGWGYEIGIANVLHVRRGHLHGTGQIDGKTRGWGLHIPFGRYGGLRYDKATVPQATGLCDVTRESAGFWIDVYALLNQE
jgi:hypothetical protein